MTKFERDLRDALAGSEIEIITERRNEIKSLNEELSKCKNNFRSHALFQQITTLKKQLTTIESHF